MGRGKKMSKPSDGRSGEAPEACRSNENKPKMNGDLGHGGQTRIDSYAKPVKMPSARLPLQDENSTPLHEGKNMGKASSDTRRKAEAEKPKRVPETEQPSTATDDKDSESSASVNAGGQKQTLTEPQKKLSPADRKPEPHRMVKAKSKRRKAHVTKSPNRKVTDYFPVRRSFRKSKAERECEEKKRIDDLITSGKEEGMKIDVITGKGRGVIATRDFCRGEFVVEYHGDLIEITDAKKREAAYAQDDSTGCYMYYFQFQNKTYCVDATKETNRLGRLINHSKSGNCHTKLHNIKNIPHLILVASRDISAGEELLYDYGDRSKSSIEAHPWLKN